MKMEAVLREWDAVVSGRVPARVLESAGALEEDQGRACLCFHSYVLVILKGPTCDRRSLTKLLSESKQ